MGDYNMLRLNTEFPLQQQDGCYYNETMKVAEVTGYINVKSGDESELKAAACAEGPLAVAINAGLYSFSSYAGGIVYCC